MERRIVLNKRKLTEESVATELQLANQKLGATEITGNAEYKKLCISVAVKYDLKLANPDKEKGLKQKREAVRNTKNEKPRKIELVCLKNRCGISSYHCEFLYYAQYAD